MAVFSSPALHFLASIIKCSRHRASHRVGFVLVRRILLRLDRIYTRLVSLRAANSSLPVVVLSVASLLSFSLCFVFGLICPVSVAKC